MPIIQKEELPKKKIKLTITVTPEEMTSFLQEAAEHISQETQIPGFRQGKAIYEAVKRHVGEMKILEQALEPMIRTFYVRALLENNLETVGSPKIDVEKMALGNDLVFTTESTLMPQVTTLANFDSLCVEAKKIDVTKEDVEKTLKELQRFQTKEVRAKKETSATKEHKIVVDMNIKKNGVSIEGGQGKGHGIYLNEPYYIPGFVEKVTGMKEDEQKNFDLAFPKEHYQKHLAGEQATFEVSLKEIYDLEPPALDDVFAKNLGQKDLESLKTLLKENLQKEQEQEEKLRQEKAILELLVEKSRFDELPDLLVNEEIQKMIEELQYHITQQGLDFQDYLTKMKKTLAELKLDFTQEAIKRIQVALILRHVAKTEHFSIETKKIDEEVEKQIQGQENEENKKQLSSAEYRNYLAVILKNRKVIDFLCKKMIKTEKTG